MKFPSQLKPVKLFYTDVLLKVNQIVQRCTINLFNTIAVSSVFVISIPYYTPAPLKWKHGQLIFKSVSDMRLTMLKTLSP